MTEKLRQSLSAVMDDEADAFELRRVLDELDRDTELRGVWSRYHLIGAAMRGERARQSTLGAEAGLGDRVWEALTEEGDSMAAAEAGAGADVPATARPGRRVWAGRLTGLAVAATVAFAVVVGFDDLQPAGGGGAPTVAGVEPAAATPAAATPAAATAAAGTPAARTPMPAADAALARVRLASEVSPSDLRRAQAYMLHHAQQQALNQAGMMSLVKMATYEKP